jgi:hypothetical protein
MANRIKIDDCAPAIPKAIEKRLFSVIFPNVVETRKARVLDPIAHLF